MADTPFLPPEQRAKKAANDFVTQYRDRLAITLKKSWNKKKMKLLGVREEPPPSDEQFKIWADELITDRKMTLLDETGNKIEPPVTIADMQRELTSEQREEFSKTYGTSQLSEIILERSQLNNAAQQVGQATYKHSGSIPFLGGASIMDAIMGFFEWVFAGFPRGKDGGIFSGLKDSIAKRATNGIASDLDGLLAKNAPTINPGMRGYIAGQVLNAGQQETGLIPAVPAEDIKSVKPGQDVKITTPSVGAGGATTTPPAKLTGNVDQDLGAVFEGVVNNAVFVRMGINDGNIDGRNKRTEFDRAKAIFKEEGTKLAKSADGQKMNKEVFAKTLITSTQKRLVDEGLIDQTKKDPMMDELLLKMQAELEAQNEVIMKAAKGAGATVIIPPAPVPGVGTDTTTRPDTITKLVTGEVKNSLRNPGNLDTLGMIAGRPLSKDNIIAIENSVVPILVKHAKDDNKALIAMKKGIPTQESPSPQDALAKQIFKQLTDNKDLINAGGGQIDGPALKVMAKQMAKQYIEKEVNKDGVKIPPDKDGVKIPPDLDFDAQLKAEEMAVMKDVVNRTKAQKMGEAKSDIKAKLTEEIKSKAMGEITGDPNAGTASPAQLINLARAKGKMGRLTAAAAKQAWLVDVTRDDALTIARRTGLAPNEQQTDRMSEIIAGAVLDVSTGGVDFKGDQKAFQNAVEAEVTKRLQANAGDINNRGNSFEKGKSTVGSLWKHGSSITWEQYANRSLNREGYNIDANAIDEAAKKAAAAAGARFPEVAKLQYKVRGKGFFPGEAKATDVKPDITPGRERTVETAR